MALSHAVTNHSRSEEPKGTRMNYKWAACSLAGNMLPGHEERQIAEEASARPKLADDVFCYPQPETWRTRIWEMLADYITDDVKAEFVRNPPEYVVSDDLGWLDDIIFAVTHRTCDIKELMGERLGREYRAFRAGHATRTSDLAPFYMQGLKCLRAEEIEDRARTIFLNGRYECANEERLQRAINDIEARKKSGGREGRLYFAAEESSLFTRIGSSGHYLIYGSEYLYCLGMRVTSTWETKRALKEIGRPTMLVCDIPIALLSPYTLKEFGGMMLEFLFCELVDGLEPCTLSPGSGSAFSLMIDLPPEHIVGHYHPASIYDPLWASG